MDRAQQSDVKVNDALLLDGGHYLESGEYVGPLERIGSDPALLALVSNSVEARAAAPLVAAISEALNLAPTYGWRASEQDAGRHSDSPVEWFLARAAFRSVADVEMAQMTSSTRSILLNQTGGDALVGWANRHPASIVGLSSGSAPELGRRLLRETASSLLFMPPPDRVHDQGPIMVPLDGSIRADSVIPFVQRLATLRKTGVLLCHVAPPREDRRMDPVLTGHFERHRDVLTQAGVEVEISYEQGSDTGPALGRLAARFAVSCVVLGSPRRMISSKGSAVIEDIVRAAVAPVFILRAGFVVDPRG